MVNQDIEAFRKALNRLEDLERSGNDTSLSIFEEACQTPNCAAFIEECIQFGCDVNRVSFILVQIFSLWTNNLLHCKNVSYRLRLIHFFYLPSNFDRLQQSPSLQKYPINFAVESHDSANIGTLLKTSSSLGIKCLTDVKYANSTPIITLCGQITDDNYQKLFACIKVLIKYSANLNISNARGFTPIHTILVRKQHELNYTNKQELLTYMFDNVHGIDIDSHRNGQARELLEQLLPGRSFPRTHNDFPQWNFNTLMDCLRTEKEAEFLSGLNQITESYGNEYPTSLIGLFSSIENDETLLILACKKGLSVAVERMLQLGANVNYSNSQQKPIEYACKGGYWTIIEILLKSPGIDVENVETPLLSIVVNKNEKNPTANRNFNKCLELLLAHPTIDINQKEANSDLTALHYAVRNKDTDIIHCLLESGAFIGIRNRFNQMSISNIDPSLLESHFDRCITTNDLRRADENFEIEFDYKNLVPPGLQRVNNTANTEKSAITAFSDEISSIEYIASTKELKHLIEHPLISSFLFLKWTRLAFAFYTNFALFVAFVLSTTLYILVCLDMKPELQSIRDALQFLTAILLVYIVIREIVQFYHSPSSYVKSIGNYVDLLLIALTAITLWTDGTIRQIGASIILLMAYELFVLAGSLPFGVYSTHFVMFKTVSLSFLKSFALYAIIIIAFSLSFFTLLHKRDEPSMDDNGNVKIEEDDDINRFGNVQSAVIKTLVMLTGEFDAASINFDKNIWNYMCFITFLFLISTVLFNLLNGLAVNDIQVSLFFFMHLVSMSSISFI